MGETNPVKNGAKYGPVTMSVVALLALVILLPITIGSIGSIAVFVDGGDNSTAWPDYALDNNISYWNPTTGRSVEFSTAGHGPNSTCIDGVIQPHTTNSVRSQCSGSSTGPEATFNGKRYLYVGSCSNMNISGSNRLIDSGCGYGPYEYDLNGGHIGLDERVINSISIHIMDRFDNYACNSSAFTEISYDYTISVEYKNSIRTLAEGNAQHYSGYHSRTQYHWNNTGQIYGIYCSAAVMFTAPVDVIQSLSVAELVGDDWHNATITIRLENFYDETRKTTAQGAGVFLPMDDKDSHMDYFRAEFTTINQADAGFTVRFITFGLAAILAVAATASTQYWDPVTSRLKGAVD